MKAKELIAVLRGNYELPQWVFVDEMRCGTGWSNEQRMDAWAMNCWPSKHFERIAFEVKVSRSDLLAELHHPEKKDSALELSNYFYFVTPVDLMKVSEIPDGCGLKVVNALGNIRTVVEAPWRPCGDIPPTFAASLLRRILMGKTTER